MRDLILDYTCDVIIVMVDGVRDVAMHEEMAHSGLRDATVGATYPENLRRPPL